MLTTGFYQEMSYPAYALDKANEYYVFEGLALVPGGGALANALGRWGLTTAAKATGSRVISEWVIAYEIKAGAEAYAGNAGLLWSLSSGSTK